MSAKLPCVVMARIRRVQPDQHTGLRHWRAAHRQFSRLPLMTSAAVVAAPKPEPSSVASRQRGRWDKTAELPLDEFCKGDRRAVFEIGSDHLHTDR